LSTVAEGIKQKGCPHHGQPIGMFNSTTDYAIQTRQIITTPVRVDMATVIVTVG
jgi:hypothetical protein